MEWYYASAGQQQGPVTGEEMQRLAAEGRLAPTDLVWHSGLGDQWVAAATVSPHWFGGGSAATQAPRPAAIPYQPVSEVSNREIMRLARESLRGRWGLGVGLCFLYAIMVNAGSLIPFAGSIIVLVIAGPLIVGFANAFLLIAQRQSAGVGHLFSGFDAFGRNFVSYLLMNLFILLWMLLLIIPGILAAYSYALTPFILAEDPSVGAREAIRRSKEMMRGNRWKLFCLFCRFIGWSLLCMLTLFIGFLWLMPYMQTSLAHFYLNVSRRVRPA